MKIRKRDGRLVDFDLNKIIDAVEAAFKEVDGEISEYAEIKAGNIADYVEEYVDNQPEGEVDVEKIQDLVEKGLMRTKRKDVRRAYIVYREEHARIRQNNTKLMRTISEKLNASNVANQNANVDEHSFGGRRGEAANELMKQYALDNCMSKMARENHLNNEIYIHKLNCA